MSDRQRLQGKAGDERAQILFALYAQMGVERSLPALHRQLHTLGVSLSMATLKRYSARHSWQSQIASINAAARQEQRKATVQDVLAMNHRHGQLARALQGAGGTALHRLISSDSRLADLKPSEIARLIDLGLRAERESIGDSTERLDIAIDIWNSVVTDVVQVFTDHNGEPDPDARARLFAHALDRLVDGQLATLKKAERRENGR